MCKIFKEVVGYELKFVDCLWYEIENSLPYQIEFIRFVLVK